MRDIEHLETENLEERKRINKRKRARLLLIALKLGVLASLVTVLKNMDDQEAKQNPSYKKESQAEDSDVVIVNMKNNKTSKELTNCVVRDIPFIVKVEPTGYTYAEIYETIDFVKRLADNTDIQYPILFDIEPLMASDTLRANCLLAEEFCNKLRANGFYVGLYGSEDSMKKFEQKFSEVTKTHSIELYDKLITYKGEKPTYDGIFNMQQKEGKAIEFLTNLASVIEKNDLNNSERYISDQKYVVMENDNLSTIAVAVNMKTEDLAEYNGISDFNSLQPGDIVVIPNQYLVETLQLDTDNEIVIEEEMPSETNTRLVKGIDVSVYQKDIDWETVQQNVDFAIVRLCDFINQQPDGTCTLDEKFYRNMEECERLNIPVGAYYYSRAVTSEEAALEAKFVADCLKNYTLEYPVYMDVETEEQNTLIAEKPNEMKEIIASAMIELEGQGYFSGVYCNAGGAQNISRKKFIEDISQSANCWITSNSTYDEEVDFPVFKDENYAIVSMPTTNICLYQYSQNGRIDGIEGNVDLNYGDVNLSKVIEEKGFSKVKVQ